MKKFSIILMVFYVCFIYFQRQSLNHSVTENDFNPEDYHFDAPEGLPKIKGQKITKKEPASVRPVKKDFSKISRDVAALFPKELATKVSIMEKIKINYQGKSVNAYKALIEHKNIQGDKSSYHAFINEETGAIMMTFDRPQSEFKKSPTLRYKGAL